MQTHQLQQGSADWHAHRATHFNASDAAAMLNCSPYMTRAQLLQRLHSGITAEVDPATQRRFDDGHRFEALARPLAEEIIGDDLAPVVGSLGELSASFDGLTLMGDTGFEHKTLRDELRACMKDEGNGYDLPKHYQAQMEQQLLVSGAERILFMATKWTPSGELVEKRHCWYASDPKLRAEIIAGWKQFAEDLAAYKPAQAAPTVAAAVFDALPAVSVRMDGALTVASNLPLFGAALRAFVERIPAQPSNDQEFADCETACKALKKAEDALDAAETGALASMESVEEMRRLVADFRNFARTARLASEKAVKARKEQIREEAVQRGRYTLAGHIAALNKRLGKPLMPPIESDFPGAIRGLKTVDSLNNAIDSELARAKIEASETADKIQLNLSYLTANASEHKSLFPDTAQIVLKAFDDLQALVTARISEHQAAEQRRQDAERERIRAEEQAKAEKAMRDRELAALQGEPARVAAAPAVPAAAPNVVPIASTRAAPAESAATIRLGQINERLAPIQLTAEGLAALGFKPVATEKTAKLYREADLPRIVTALHGVLDKALELQAA